MNTWDFLIQREGEKTWSSVANISRLEAGKYRLMVRTPKLNQGIDISITYCPESDLRVTKRRKYYRQTNDRGFLAILPFTPLGTGSWEISCRPDLMSELCGENWHKKIILEVGSNKEIQTQQQLELATEIARFKQKRYSILEQNLAELTINRNTKESLSLELDSFIFEESKHRISIQEMIHNIEDGDFESDPEKEMIPNELVPINQIEESKQEELCVGEIVANSEESSSVASRFRFINYAIELTYLEYNSSIIFDIEVFEPDHQSSKPLDLPDPTKMKKFLRKKYVTKEQVLPPKLYPDYIPSNRKKSLQFSKFQPYPLSA
jgi:hypothetical protein